MDNDTSKNRINRFCDKLGNFAVGTVDIFVYGILIFALMSVPVCIFLYCTKYSSIFSAFEILWFIPGIALIGLCGFIARKLQNNEKLLIGVMIGIEIIIACVMIFSYDTKPCSDYEVIWDQATRMADGTFTAGLDKTHYMYYFNWQIGISALESIVFRLGGNFFTLKCINAVLLICIQLLEYFIVKQKFGKKVAAYAYVLATLFMPWCLSIPQFTNHHIGLVLLLVVFLLFEKKKIWSCLVAGVLLAVVEVLRPIGIIVIIASICVSLYWLIKDKELKTILLPIAMIIAYVAVCGIFNHTFVAVGYTDQAVTDARVPYYKFQKGLYGYNNEIEQDLPERDYDYNEYNRDMKDELFSRLRNDPVGVAKFVGGKMIQFLGMFDYQFENTYNHDVDFYTSYPVKALYSISWMQYIVVLILAVVGYKTYRQKKSVDIYQIFFIGNVLVYIFIEAFSSYRFEIYPMLIMFAALGYAKVEEYIPNLLKLKKSDQFE